MSLLDERLDLTLERYLAAGAGHGPELDPSRGAPDYRAVRDGYKRWVREEVKAALDHPDVRNVPRFGAAAGAAWANERER